MGVQLRHLDYRQRSVVRKYLVSDYGKIKHLEH